MFLPLGWAAHRYQNVDVVQVVNCIDLKAIFDSLCRTTLNLKGYLNEPETV